MPPANPPLSPLRHRWDIWLLLVAICLVGNYYYVSYFGMYEDDFLYSLPAFHWTWADCWAQIRTDLIVWPDGRVVSCVFNDLITWFSGQGSSLELGYALGAAMLVTNTLLCYRLARTWFPPLGAFAAAAVYCLNPADTAKVILMHRSQLLLGSMFLLTALLAYRVKRPWIAYLAAALSLLTYESFFFPFLAAPLLLLSRKEFSWRCLLRHGAACAVILGIVIAIRANMGEPRVIESLDTIPVLAGMISHAMIIGPQTCLQTLILRPLDALRYSGPSQCGLIIGLVVVSMAVFSTGMRTGQSGTDQRVRLESFLLFIPGCLLLLALCYAVTVHRAYYPPVVTIGRLSGFNATAAIPLGLLVGAIVTLLAGRAVLTRAVVAALGLFLGALVSAGLQIQRVEYVTNWQQQRNYWNELLNASGEWAPGVAVLVQFDSGGGLPATAGFPPFWMVNYSPLLGQWLVDAPGLDSSEIDRHPRVFGFSPTFKATPMPGGLRLQTPPSMDPAMWPVIREGNFLYYNFADGHLARKTGQVNIGGRLLTPKPLPATPVPPLPRNFLYYLLFGPPQKWPTIAGARNYPP